MPKMTVSAPAKLNLHLQVGDKRPDGCHEIESLFLALAFGDTLCLETVPQPLSFEICMNSAINPDKNIISRAVLLFRERTGYTGGLNITVEKRIPLGGGLGGGSSDAAAALWALNRLAAPAAPGLLGDTELVEMGASLGSDVPFFLYIMNQKAAAAWVSGRGEKVRPFKMPESIQNLAFVLVNPGFPSDTAEAYRLLDIYRELHTPHSFRKICANIKQRLHSSFLTSNSSFLDWPFFNDFLPVFQAEAGKPSAFSEAGTAYQYIISCLKELGADFAGLSGSGSTCFGVFIDRKKADAAHEFLLQRWSFVVNTFCLRPGQYCGII